MQRHDLRHVSLSMPGILGRIRDLLDQGDFNQYSIAKADVARQLPYITEEDTLGFHTSA